MKLEHSSWLSTLMKNGYEALDADGVWIFRHPASGIRPLSLAGGEAAVRGNCLFIGDELVVWHPDSMQTALDAVDAALEDERLRFIVGGSGWSVIEDDRPIPDIVSERCDTDSIWIDIGP